MKSKPRYKPGDRIGGRFQIHQVKMGGMGEVYFCTDLENDYSYALKTFQISFMKNIKLRKLFEEEISTWVAIGKHPNIVQCLYLDYFDNQPFMRLEWVSNDENLGVDLRNWLRNGPLPLQMGLDLIIDICRGLIFVREKQSGLVHRDLKPENILIDYGRVAKITDFGLAEEMFIIN